MKGCCRPLLVKPQWWLAILLGIGSVLSQSSEAAPFVFQPAGSMNVARSEHTATLLLDGRVLVAGGQNDNGVAIGSAELYDRATGKWTNTGSLGNARQNHTATLLPSGLVLVAGGGLSPFGDTTATAELYNPTTGAWTPTGSMNTPRELHTAAVGQVAEGAADWVGVLPWVVVIKFRV